MVLSRLFGRRKRRVFVIGLDCAAPELVFTRWRDALPNLRHLTEQGLWGDLSSSIPAITVPAWSSMLSSKDPGTLGIYGFRNRADYSYDKMTVALSPSVREKRVWDYVTAAGKSSVVIGVPQTFPVKPLNGRLISGFLTPGPQADFAYPATVRDDVLRIAPDYAFDVGNFRTDDKSALLERIHAMTRQHFAVVEHYLRDNTWDFFMLMEIGVDRIHHGFWQYHDPEHWRYQAGNPYENAIFDYYKLIDEAIGRWLNMLDDDTMVMVVSDHGAKRMDGGVCINEWLWREGWLHFQQDPVPGQRVRFDDMAVDWSRTRAWGSGGYYGRIFLNVAGREPQGIIASGDYEAVRDDLAARIRAIPKPDGSPMQTQVFKPQAIYQRVTNIAPDLMVYFDDLYWRSVGSLGYDGIYTRDNDTGPDDCNHAQNGLCILYDGRNPISGGRALQAAQLMDIAPTILNALNLPVPDELQGQLLHTR